MIATGTALACASVFGVLFCASTRRTALLLGVAAASPAFAITVAGGSVHLFVLLCGAWLIARPSRLAELRIDQRLMALAVSAVPIAATAYIGPFVNRSSLALVFASLMVAAIVVFHIATDYRAELVHGFVVANVLGLGLALLQTAHLAPGSLIHEDISRIGRPASWYIEPDWLGLFAATTVLLALYDSSLNRRLAQFALPLASIALIVSFARAAWIGLAAGVVVHRVATRSRRSSRKRRRGPIVVAAIVCAGLVALVPALRTDLGTRVSSILGGPASSDLGGHAREQQRRGLLDLANSSPWYGGGLSASGRVGVSGKLTLTGTAQNNVGSNWLLALWVDAKFLALPFVATLGAALARFRRSIYMPLLAAVLVSSLASNAFYFPVTWMAIALVHVSTIDQRFPLRRLAATGHGPPRSNWDG